MFLAFASPNVLRASWCPRQQQRHRLAVRVRAAGEPPEKENEKDPLLSRSEAEKKSGPKSGDYGFGKEADVALKSLANPDAIAVGVVAISVLVALALAAGPPPSLLD